VTGHEVRASGHVFALWLGVIVRVVPKVAVPLVERSPNSSDAATRRLPSLEFADRSTCPDAGLHVALGMLGVLAGWRAAQSWGVP
jgi:hypothetical protein